MENDNPKFDLLRLAKAVFQHRRTKHPYGSNYAVSIRMGHADIQDFTAIADILLAVEELGYEIKKKPE